MYYFKYSFKCPIFYFSCINPFNVLKYFRIDNYLCIGTETGGHMKRYLTQREAAGLKVAVISTIIFVLLTSICSSLNINDIMHTLMDAESSSFISFVLAIFTYIAGIMIIEGVTMAKTINERFQKASGYTYVIVILIAAILTAGIIAPRIGALNTESFNTAFTSISAICIVIVYIFAFLSIRQIVFGSVDYLIENSEGEWAIRMRKEWKGIVVGMVATFIISMVFAILIIPGSIVAFVAMLAGEAYTLAIGMIVAAVVLVIALAVFSIIMLVDGIRILINVWRIGVKYEALN